MRLYTRTGDDGETGLVGGARVPKDSRRVETYGTVDELNSVLGVVVAELDAERDADLIALLRTVQAQLFDVGADLATPKPSSAGTVAPRLTREAIATLESAIDRLDDELPPLRTFILPGGSVVGARLHVARTVCRRAERAVVALAREEDIRPEILVYLNRLSDLLFVMARTANARRGVAEIPWHPEETR